MWHLKKMCINWFQREGVGREREKEKPQFVVPLTDTFLGWFLYASWVGIERKALVYANGAVANLATWPGPTNMLCYSYSPEFTHWNIHGLGWAVGFPVCSGGPAATLSVSAGFTGTPLAFAKWPSRSSSGISSNVPRSLVRGSVDLAWA